MVKTDGVGRGYVACLRDADSYHAKEVR